MSVEEFVHSSKQNLQTALGDDYSVMNWVYNSHFSPDKVFVKNLVNGKYDWFGIEIADACDHTVLQMFAIEVADRLR